ncbi:hypothetical protein AB0O39_30545 [Streptomyces anulatus]|uniref:hypothetical protein n=1 Tax=Streptomyces anulatus TaxID=1892 RepID=UPI00343F5AF0
MSLQFIGIDRQTGDDESPTVWIDQEKGELVFQGWKLSPQLEAECAALELTGNAVGIPDTEAVVRIPARMVDVIRKACDALECADHVR